MNWVQKILATVLAIILVAILGCSAWQDGITPAYIDPAAINYSGENPLVFTPYTSLWDLKRIDRALDLKHYKTQVEISRYVEDDRIKYNYLKDGMQINMISAEELKGTLFSPTGPIGLLMAAAPAFGLGALLISKPSDKKRITELENGKTPA